jgi:hypothetical protein
VLGLVMRGANVVRDLGRKKPFGPDFDRSRFDKDFVLMLYVTSRCGAVLLKLARRSFLGTGDVCCCRSGGIVKEL